MLRFRLHASVEHAVNGATALLSDICLVTDSLGVPYVISRLLGVQSEPYKVCGAAGQRVRRGTDYRYVPTRDGVTVSLQVVAIYSFRLEAYACAI